MPNHRDTIVSETAGIARNAIDGQTTSKRLNLLGDIEWGHREKIRTIQGLLTKVEDACSELLWSVDAVEACEQLWPGSTDFED